MAARRRFHGRSGVRVMLGVALSGRSRLLGRGGALGGGAVGGVGATDLTAAMGGRVAGVLAAAGTAFLLGAAIVLVEFGRGPPLGLFFRHAAVLVALVNVVGLAFLLVGIFGFVATGH